MDNLETSQTFGVKNQINADINELSFDNDNPDKKVYPAQCTQVLSKITKIDNILARVNRALEQKQECLKTLNFRNDKKVTAT